jgi:hypothetical protein
MTVQHVLSNTYVILTDGLYIKFTFYCRNMDSGDVTKLGFRFSK